MLHSVESVLGAQATASLLPSGAEELLPAADDALLELIDGGQVPVGVLGHGEAIEIAAVDDVAVENFIAADFHADLVAGLEVAGQGPVFGDGAGQILGAVTEQVGVARFLLLPGAAGQLAVFLAGAGAVDSAAAAGAQRQGHDQGQAQRQILPFHCVVPP